MLIINPIYDASFKYLMDHTEIAKGIISLMIGEEIIELTPRSQEAITTVEVNGSLMNVYRMDFSAKIKTKQNQEKQVLIELQKSKVGKDVIRFRKYLGINYQRHESKQVKIRKSNKDVTELCLEYAIPIISIYFLGHKLSSKIATPVVCVKRHYFDMRTKTLIKKKDKFIENLTHDAYFIQIPYLQEPYQSKLERVLSVFDQHYKDKEDEKLMHYDVLKDKDELLAAMLKVLSSATLDTDLKVRMELEEAENMAIRNRMVRQSLRYEKKIAEIESKLEDIVEEAEKQKQEAEKQKQEAEKQKQEAEKVENQKREAIFNLHHNLKLTVSQIASIYKITELEVENLLNQA